MFGLFWFGSGLFGLVWFFFQGDHSQSESFLVAFWKSPCKTSQRLDVVSEHDFTAGLTKALPAKAKMFGFGFFLCAAGQE